MSEGYCAMMWIIFLDQHMTVKPSHFRNGKDTDGAKGAGCYRKDFSLGDVCPQFVVCGTLQTVEGNVARLDIAL